MRIYVNTIHRKGPYQNHPRVSKLKPASEGGRCHRGCVGAESEGWGCGRVGGRGNSNRSGGRIQSISRYGISSFQKKETLEKETENILDRMEDSYQRLEKVLKVFNRML